MATRRAFVAVRPHPGWREVFPDSSLKLLPALIHPCADPAGVFSRGAVLKLISRRTKDVLLPVFSYFLDGRERSYHIAIREAIGSFPASLAFLSPFSKPAAVLYLFHMDCAVLDELRLSDIEKKALTSAISDVEGEVYVFGSRTSKEARGGDIDILIIPS